MEELGFNLGVVQKLNLVLQSHCDPLQQTAKASCPIWDILSRLQTWLCCAPSTRGQSLGFIEKSLEQLVCLREMETKQGLLPACQLGMHTTKTQSNAWQVGRVRQEAWPCTSSSCSVGIIPCHSAF